MTRINLIPVEELTNQHLLAEHRELKRIPSMIQKGKVNFSNIPNNYTLGKGHVKFFYNKLGFLKNRYIYLYNECIKRGFNVENYIGNFDNIPKNLFGNFTPSENDLDISKQRIKEKIQEKPDFYTYFKEK